MGSLANIWTRSRFCGFKQSLKADRVPHHSGFARHGHSKHLDVHLFSIVLVVVVVADISTTLEGIAITLPGGAQPAQYSGETSQAFARFGKCLFYLAVRPLAHKRSEPWALFAGVAN